MGLLTVPGVLAVGAGDRGTRVECDEEGEKIAEGVPPAENIYAPTCSVDRVQWVPADAQDGSTGTSHPQKSECWSGHIPVQGTTVGADCLRGSAAIHGDSADCDKVDSDTVECTTIIEAQGESFQWAQAGYAEMRGAAGWIDRTCEWERLTQDGRTDCTLRRDAFEFPVQVDRYEKTCIGPDEYEDEIHYDGITFLARGNLSTVGPDFVLQPEGCWEWTGGDTPESPG